MPIETYHSTACLHVLSLHCLTLDTTYHPVSSPLPPSYLYKDAMGVMRTVALEELAFNLVGLSSETTYEFKVCAVNKVGPGVWSDPTPVIVLRALDPSKVFDTSKPTSISLVETRIYFNSNP